MTMFPRIISILLLWLFCLPALGGPSNNPNFVNGVVSKACASLQCLAQLPLTGAGKGAPGGGAVSTVLFDAKSSSVANSAPASTSFTEQSMVVSLGLTNSALIYIVISGDGTTITSPMATWDNTGTPQPMTLIGSATNSTQQLFLFGLLNPKAGGAPVAAFSWTGASTVRSYAASFQNVKQTSVAAAFPGFNSATNAAPISVGISSAVGDKAIGSFLSLANFTSLSGTTLNINNTFSVWAWGANYDTGAATTTLSGNPGSATTSLAVGVNIKAF